MKHSKYCQFFIIAFFFGLASGPAYSQTEPAIKDPSIHTKDYFLRLQYTRLVNSLVKSVAALQQEKEIITRLASKNDSLLEQGNILDLTAAGYHDQLAGCRQKVDSLLEGINSKHKSLASFSSYRRQYKNANTKIAGFDRYLQNTISQHELLLKNIAIGLDTSNLSGEKTRLKTMLNAASEQQTREAARLGGISSKKDSLLQRGIIEANTALKIDQRLQSYQKRMDSIGVEINGLSAQLNSPSDFSKGFKIIKAKIILIDSVINKNASIREYIFSMIDEGLSKPNRNLFDMAAFFGPGGYLIPESKEQTARKYFSPIIDSLVKFSNKYEFVLRIASMQVDGYADATAINPPSALFKFLAGRINKSNPSPEELNEELSALRAAEVSRFLTLLLKEKFAEFKSNDKIVFEALERGQGEKLPDPHISDYRKNDERRRVVIIFWTVLPTENTSFF